MKLQGSKVSPKRLRIEKLQSKVKKMGSITSNMVNAKNERTGNLIKYTSWGISYANAGKIEERVLASLSSNNFNTKYYLNNYFKMFLFLSECT
jgi:hypothetical protein